ncbi:MAG: hypothetical protein ACI87E_004119 [Mariniblastus sp.]|jgi:hypothetical protein
METSYPNSNSLNLVNLLSPVIRNWAYFFVSADLIFQQYFHELPIESRNPI